MRSIFFKKERETLSVHCMPSVQSFVYSIGDHRTAWQILLNLSSVQFDLRVLLHLLYAELKGLS